VVVVSVYDGLGGLRNVTETINIAPSTKSLGEISS